jgi:hypothetical protein
LGGTGRETATVRVASMLLLAISMLALLGGCFGSGEQEKGGGGETAADETVVTEETAAETTSAAGGETTAADGETTAARGETTAEFAATNVSLLPSRDSGVNGTTNVTDTPTGVWVALEVQGLLTRPGTELVAHVHEGGTCDGDRAGNGAPIRYPLDPLLTQGDGTASSATPLDGVILEQLTSGPSKYVNVHGEPVGEGIISPSIACADLPGTDSGEATTGAAGGGETTASG